jgi:hypothetical protein
MASATDDLREAAHSETMTVLARWGLAARATVYLLIGVVAIAIAFGSSHAEADQRGALQALTRHPGGTVLVLIIGAGLAGYALWRLSEAVFGVAGEGRKPGPRAQSFCRAVIYGFFAFSAFEIVFTSGVRSQAGQEQSITAKVMRHSGGRWAVGLVGVIVVICGLVLAWDGIRRKFERNLELGRMGKRARRIVPVLGVVGGLARGIVFGLAGVLVVSAAWTFDPKRASGLDGALRKVAVAPAGRWLLLAVALGLLVFAAFGFAAAKWHKT